MGDWLGIVTVVKSYGRICLKYHLQCLKDTGYKWVNGGTAEQKCKIIDRWSSLPEEWQTELQMMWERNESEQQKAPDEKAQAQTERDIRASGGDQENKGGGGKRVTIAMTGPMAIITPEQIRWARKSTWGVHWAMVRATTAGDPRWGRDKNKEGYIVDAQGKVDGKATEEEDARIKNMEKPLYNNYGDRLPEDEEHRGLPLPGIIELVARRHGKSVEIWDYAKVRVYGENGAPRIAIAYLDEKVGWITPTPPMPDKIWERHYADRKGKRGGYPGEVAFGTKTTVEKVSTPPQRSKDLGPPSEGRQRGKQKGGEEKRPLLDGVGVLIVGEIGTRTRPSCCRIWRYMAKESPR